MAYFPMFVDITDMDCLIVGGGDVALRKAEVMLDFGTRVVLVAKEISSCLYELQKENSNITLIERKFLIDDIKKMNIVIAATNDEELNLLISQRCKEMNIPVNVVDDKEKCSFIFPSYIKEKNLVAAFSSGGNSPILTQMLKKKVKEIVTPKLGELNEKLGEERAKVIASIPSEEERKLYYEQMICRSNKIFLE